MPARCSRSWSACSKGSGLAAQPGRHPGRGLAAGFLGRRRPLRLAPVLGRRALNGVPPSWPRDQQAQPCGLARRTAAFPRLIFVWPTVVCSCSARDPPADAVHPSGSWTRRACRSPTASAARCSARVAGGAAGDGGAGRLISHVPGRADVASCRRPTLEVDGAYVAEDACACPWHAPRCPEPIRHALFRGEGLPAQSGNRSPPRPRSLLPAFRSASRPPTDSVDPERAILLAGANRPAEIRWNGRPMASADPGH